MEYDAGQFKIVELRSGALNMDADVNMHIGDVKAGYLTMSYDGDISADEALPLFEMVVESRGNLVAGQKLFAVTSSHTRAEAYDSELNRISLRLDDAGAGKAAITSVTPNPFMKDAKLNFTLPKAGKVQFEFYDVNGRILNRQQSSYEAGPNTLNLQRADFETQGFVYLRMLTDDEIIEYRMIVL